MVGACPSSRATSCRQRQRVCQISGLPRHLSLLWYNFGQTPTGKTSIYVTYLYLSFMLSRLAMLCLHHWLKLLDWKLEKVQKRFCRTKQLRIKIQTYTLVYNYFTFGLNTHLHKKILKFCIFIIAAVPGTQQGVNTLWATGKEIIYQHAYMLLLLVQS